MKLTKHPKMKNLTNLVSKLMLKPNLLNCSDFTIFFIENSSDDGYLFVSSANLFYFLNSRNPFWSWRSFRRWRIWQIRFQSWCWNQTCEIVQISRFFFYQISSNDGCLFISSANLLILLSKFQESVLKLTKLLKMKNLTNSVSKLMLKPNLLYCSDFLMSAVYDVYVLYAALIYFIF